MANLFRADIHCHSICSDGSDTPLELLIKAKQVGLQGLSITDHDTAAAYTQEFHEAAHQFSIRILTGIEISSELQQSSVHILGYGYDLASLSFASFLQEMQRWRRARNQAILEKLAQKNMLIHDVEFEGPNSQLTQVIKGRPHIASLMVEKGYVKSVREAFDRYLGDQASCYVPGFRFAPEEVIEQIQKAGGKAILAHPHFYRKGVFLERILSCPFDGIECYYAALSQELERPWIDLAAKKKWLVTGGSDYHGTYKPHIALGASWVDESTFDILSCNTKK